MNGRIGTLYAVGVGPGEPELPPVRAVRVLREVDRVFAAGHERSGRSRALEAARPHIPPATPVEVIGFSHTFQGLETRRVHRGLAPRIAACLREGRSAAFLTLGDPSTYSTFSYFLEALREVLPDVPLEVVPGVTSFAAAAAAAGVPLAEGDEGFAVVSASRGLEPVRRALDAVENVVILKPYRNTAAVCDLLEARGLASRTLYASRCSLPGALTRWGVDHAREDTEYLSLFLVKGGGGPRP